MCSIQRPIWQILLSDHSKEVMAIAATSLMRPKIFGPKATGLDRFHCIDITITGQIAGVKLAVDHSLGYLE